MFNYQLATIDEEKIRDCVNGESGNEDGNESPGTPLRIRYCLYLLWKRYRGG